MIRTVSPAGVAFILRFEGYLPHPYVPSDTSGVTIGYGYDLSAVTPEQFAADWAGVLNDDGMVRRLQACCGLRGHEAKVMASSAAIASIVVSRHAADVVFQGKSLPDYTKRAVKACPGFEALSQGAVDALVSLGYNRGWDMGTPSKPSWDRRKEMRDIRSAVANRDEAGIRGALVSMADRLWPSSNWITDPVAKGLHSRRMAEADMIR